MSIRGMPPPRVVPSQEDLNAEYESLRQLLAEAPPPPEVDTVQKVLLKQRQLAELLQLDPNRAVCGCYTCSGCDRPCFATSRCEGLSAKGTPGCIVGIVSYVCFKQCCRSCSILCVKCKKSMHEDCWKNTRYYSKQPDSNEPLCNGCGFDKFHDK